MGLFCFEKTMKDLLGGTKQTNAPLYASLHATKTAFIKRFNFDSFPLVTNDDHKGAVKKDRNITSSAYPYQYWKITTVQIRRDMGNVKTHRRHGTALAGATDNTAYSMGYYFPCTVDCTFHYTSNNIQDTLAMIERWLILMQTEALNVKVHIPIGNQGVDFVNRIYTEDNSVPFPEASLEDESSPGNFGLEMSFRIDGYIGTSKDVPKFNNEGEITYNLVPNKTVDS